MLEPEPIVASRKKPSQMRSIRTIELILDVAAQILEAQGEEAVTTKNVAEKAGVSIGTLYQYFSNRDAVLVALAEQERQQIAERMRMLFGQIDVASSTEPAQEFVRALVRSYARRRGAKRQFALMATIKSSDGKLLLQDEFAEALAQFWSRSGISSKPAVNKVNAYVMTHAILGVLRAAALENSVVLRDPGFEEALCSIVLALRPSGMA